VLRAAGCARAFVTMASTVFLVGSRTDAWPVGKVQVGAVVSTQAAAQVIAPNV